LIKKKGLIGEWSRELRGDEARNPFRFGGRLKNNITRDIKNPRLVGIKRNTFVRKGPRLEGTP